jgi:hypothetical protein
VSCSSPHTVQMRIFVFLDSLRHSSLQNAGGRPCPAYDALNPSPHMVQIFITSMVPTLGSLGGAISDLLSGFVGFTHTITHSG